MKNILAIICLGFLAGKVLCQVRTIHVFVALCDNEHQGIVPVPKSLGNGKDPKNNLYWGATFGIKSFFKNTAEWQFLSSPMPDNPAILERLLFKHATDNTYLLAEAYDGERIQTCVEDFLKAANGQEPKMLLYGSLILKFGGDADLLAYVGHDGLMDFSVDIKYYSAVKKEKDIFILACFSKNYFTPEILKAKAEPLLWTTHLMAPEAYSLKSAIDGWILMESGTAIKERAAQSYNKYQKCGIAGARNLFTTGF